MQKPVQPRYNLQYAIIFYHNWRNTLNRASYRRWLIPLIVGLLALSLDQLSKWWAVRTLGPEPFTGVIPLIGDWSRLVYSRNTGIAFSMLQGHPEILTLTALAIISGAIYFYWNHLPSQRLLPQLVIGLIVGGALGNVIDRVRLGYVVDFISVGWWPIFNLADSAIFVGAALLMVMFVRDDIEHRRDRQQAVSI